VPVLRRSSGGGTVLLGAGCLLYSLVLDQERESALAEIQPSYRFILGRVAAALGGDAGQAGISDLAIGGRKFSGNAQQRKRRHLLHHGTLLYAFDLGKVGHYLRPPPRQPEYRAGRDHGEFLLNLPLTIVDLKRRLCAAWEADTGTDVWPEEDVRRMVAEKYSLAAWVRRR
jgi:lipoate-protein ligase A